MYKRQGQSNVGYYKLANVSMAALASTQFTGLSGVTLIRQEAVSYTHLDVYKRQGAYIIKEKAAPEGFVLNTAAYDVELAYAGQTIEVVYELSLIHI